MRKIILFLICVVCCIAVLPVQAHSNLERSVPGANASLTDTPSEIRLWFSEPLEPSFSRIILRDATGSAIETQSSSVDPIDTHQLMLPLETLADGLYTVSWRVVSAADGHPTEGSFTFGLNVTAMPTASSAPINEAVSLDSVVIRAFQFFANSIAIGSLGAWYFLWRPIARSHVIVDQILYGMMWCGWGLLGAASILFLLLQTSTTAAISLGEALSHPALINLLMQTTFGRLWLLRFVLWVTWGAVLFVSRGHRQRLWIVLGLSAGVLLTQSLFSHASATQEWAAIAADWLHLLATTLWVGGLIAFVLILIPLRHEKDDLTRLTIALVASFSNYARVCVAILIITGLYATWLQVGSVEALLNTRYGQALVVKLLLFVPLLLIAAVNLLWTHRQLQQGSEIWVSRLRGLMGAEIALTCGILLAVAMMTSGSPARGIQALRDAVVAAPPPYLEMEMADDLMIHLDIRPGVVGENEFHVSLANMTTGAAITDASLIRLRFDNLDQNYGQSELRPTLTQNGEYLVTGANLSAPGEWRIRVSIQRPGKYDTVKDFKINPVLPTAAPTIETQPPLWDHLFASTLTGLALLGIGGFLGGWRASTGRVGGRILAGAAIIVGLIFLLNAASSMSQNAKIVISEVYARPATQGMTAAVYFIIDNQTPFSDQLVSIETSVAGKATLHRTSVKNDIAQMDGIVSLDVPAFSKVDVNPGDLHVMLDDLHQDLTVGQSFDMRLTFASGKTIPVTAIVQDN